MDTYKNEFLVYAKVHRCQSSFEFLSYVSLHHRPIVCSVSNCHVVSECHYNLECIFNLDISGSLDIAVSLLDCRGYDLHSFESQKLFAFLMYCCLVIIDEPVLG